MEAGCRGANEVGMGCRGVLIARARSAPFPVAVPGRGDHGEESSGASWRAPVWGGGGGGFRGGGGWGAGAASCRSGLGGGGGGRLAGDTSARLLTRAPM